MTIGTFKEHARSRKGAAQVKIDGAYYYVGKANVDGLTPGMRIDFVSNTFGDRGDLKGLVSWKPYAESAGPSGQASPAPAFDGDMLRFASNVVAHAILKDLIKEPKDITPWFWAAMDCPKASDEEPPFNDDIP